MCDQATSHYLSQWWQRSMMPDGISEPQSTMQCRYDSVNCPPNPHKIHPIARPWGRGMSFVFCEFDRWLSSVPVITVPYIIEHYIGSRYNGMRLYVSLYPFLGHRRAKQWKLRTAVPLRTRFKTSLVVYAQPARMLVLLNWKNCQNVRRLSASLSR